MHDLNSLPPKDRALLLALGADNVTVVSASTVRMLKGDAGSAVFLAHLLSWNRTLGRRAQLDDGWFYRTFDEIEEQTGLGQSAQRRARKRLVEVEVIEVSQRGMPAKTHYRLYLDVLVDLLVKQAKTAEFPSMDTSTQPRLDTRAQPCMDTRAQPCMDTRAQPTPTYTDIQQTTTDAQAPTHTQEPEADAAGVVVLSGEDESEKAKAEHLGDPRNQAYLALIEFGIDAEAAKKIAADYTGRVPEVLRYCRAEGKGPGFAVKAFYREWDLSPTVDPAATQAAKHQGRLPEAERSMAVHYRELREGKAAKPEVVAQSMAEINDALEKAEAKKAADREAHAEARRQARTAGLPDIPPEFRMSLAGNGVPSGEAPDPTDDGDDT